MRASVNVRSPTSLTRRVRCFCSATKMTHSSQVMNCVIQTTGCPTAAACCLTSPVDGLCVAVCAQAVLAAGSAEPPAGADRLHPTFITTWSCPYAQRSWIALNAKKLQYTPVSVDL
jgi:hypothetical protein